MPENNADSIQPVDSLQATYAGAKHKIAALEQQLQKL
jgi:hypothetical protein